MGCNKKYYLLTFTFHVPIGCIMAPLPALGPIRLQSVRIVVFFQIHRLLQKQQLGLRPELSDLMPALKI